MKLSDFENTGNILSILSTIPEYKTAVSKIVPFFKTFKESERNEIINSLIVKKLYEIKTKEINDSYGPYKEEFIKYIENKGDFLDYKTEKDVLNNLSLESGSYLPLKVLKPGTTITKDIFITEKAIALVDYMPYNKETNKAIRNSFNWEKFEQDIMEIRKNSTFLDKKMEVLMPEIFIPAEENFAINGRKKVVKEELLPLIQKMYEKVKDLLPENRKELKKLIENLKNPVQNGMETNDFITTSKRKEQKGLNLELIKLLIEKEIISIPGIKIEDYIKNDITPKDKIKYVPKLSFFELDKGEIKNKISELFFNIGPNQSYLDQKSLLENLENLKTISKDNILSNNSTIEGVKGNDIIKAVNSIKAFYKKKERETNKEKENLKNIGE